MIYWLWKLQLSKYFRREYIFDYMMWILGISVLIPTSFDMSFLIPIINSWW